MPLPEGIVAVNGALCPSTPDGRCAMSRTVGPIREGALARWRAAIDGTTLIAQRDGVTI
jgi:hypothetical protein